MAGLRLLHRVDGEEAHSIGHLGVAGIDCRSHRLQGDSSHSVRLFRSIICSISGVRMSCMARSSLAPWITIELARDMKLCGIIESRLGKSMPRGFFMWITTIDLFVVLIQCSMIGLEVSIVGSRLKLMSVSVNCGQM